MPVVQVHGARLYYEMHGSGEPVAFVHGSWVDATHWTPVVAELVGSFRVLVYDRRGHSRSERLQAQGDLDEDGDDLAGMLEACGLVPAHVVSNSSGGNIALRLACRRPEVFQSLVCHEPPLWGLLDNGNPQHSHSLAVGSASLRAVGARIAAGDHVGAARQFVEEVAFGAGAWDELSLADRRLFSQNASTYLDELQDPKQFSLDEEDLTNLAVPVRLTQGSESPPLFGYVIERLLSLAPDVSCETINGAGHIPHLTAPRAYAEVVTRAIRSCGTAPS
jgi:pimeloyl-ACP methyl ester carboxylesterase